MRWNLRRGREWIVRETDKNGQITATMFNCESDIISPDQVDIIPPGLSAIVGFGGKISGYVAIHLSPESACTLASNLLGMNFVEMDDIVADAMGELVNMLAGGLKKFACKNEDLFRISVPSIVYGMDYSTHAPKNAERLMIGVQAGACTFSWFLKYASRFLGHPPTPFCKALLPVYAGPAFTGRMLRSKCVVCAKNRVLAGILKMAGNDLVAISRDLRSENFPAAG
jgi:chemotaxis protein CheX